MLQQIEVHYFLHFIGNVFNLYANLCDRIIRFCNCQLEEVVFQQRSFVVKKVN